MGRRWDQSPIRVHHEGGACQRINMCRNVCARVTNTVLGTFGTDVVTSSVKRERQSYLTGHL